MSDTGNTPHQTTARRVAFALVTTLAASAALTSTACGEGSELPDGSVIIKALPFTDTGDTSDNIDNFDAVCPYSGSTSPDVFYKITPLSDVEITITLCNSDYDTKVYVLNSSLTLIACNDDFCEDENGDPTLRSQLDCVPLEAGRDYHIAVDGFSQDGNGAGLYEITVTVCEPPPPFSCPKGATPEGEPCVDGAPDDFNGGCNSEPPVFSEIFCNDVICGEVWALGDGGLRDTDWYEIDTRETKGSVRFTLRGEFSFETGVLGLIMMTFGNEGKGLCDEVLGVNPFVFGNPGEIVRVTTEFLPPGRHWFFVAPLLDNEIACTGSNDYWFELTCEDEPPPCNFLCPWDLDKTGAVDIGDLLQILTNWGPCPE